MPEPAQQIHSSALQLYTQIVGKYRLARTPWINHSWQATFYINARRFTSSLVPDGPGGVEIGFEDQISGQCLQLASANSPTMPRYDSWLNWRWVEL